MALLFISYRVATAASYASRLNDWLVAHFEKEAIFYDRGDLRPGENWRERLRREIESSVAVLAIIDRNWLASFVERSGSDDIVRFELETAIELGKTIMPLLVGGHRLEMKEASTQLPPSLHPVLDHHFHVLDDTTTAAYETSIRTLIEAIQHLDALVATVGDTAIEFLTAKNYLAAERLLVRQPEAVRQQANLSVYLALARLAGRSFNALRPAERETIERLLRRARASASSWELPMLLLAILEIDYYQLHGMASAAPVRPADVVYSDPPDERSRSLLAGLYVSRRARRELRLDPAGAGAV